ncbi:MAG: serine hydrolase domain-containing protein [Bacteroidota bacterium]
MKINVLFAFLLIGTQAFTQSKELTNRLDEVTQFIEERMDVEPGTTVIITQEGKTIYTASNGLSSIELNTKNNLNTMYDLASIAKMFTGYCIATLELEGKIAMDDDIREYLPNFPVYDHTITIGHLVHHTSGIKNWTNLLYQMGWSSEDQITTDQLLRAIYAQKSLNFVPGDDYRYCNSGYVLLTEIIETVTGQSFVDWTDEHIFRPLEMTQTLFNDDINRVIPGMASAYSYNAEGHHIREAYNTSALGSSSLISNATDMAKWMNFLLDPPAEKKEVITRMFSTVPLNDGSENTYAYGIDLSSYNGTQLITHSGSWASFTSLMAILPEHNIGIFFANNFRAYTRGMLEYYVDALFPPAEGEEEETTTASVEEEEEVVVSSDLLQKYLGTYKLGEAWYVEITLRGDELYTQANGENAFYMKPLDDSTFLVRAYGNRTITFNTNATGEVYQFFYNDIEAKRKSDPFYFDAKEFQKFAGVYYNTEVDLLFELVVEDDRMYYSNIKNGTYELLYENDELFFSDGILSKITFDYDQEGKVQGFHKVNYRKERLYYLHKAN